MIKKKFLVLGSNSFSGSSFCNYLIKKNINFHAISRSSEINRIFLSYKWDNHKIKFHKIDINKNLPILEKLIKKFKPNYIVNFAAQAMVAQSWKYPEDWFQTNVMSLLKFVNFLKNLDFLDKYIHVTTPEVYGSQTTWSKESFNFNPTTPYAVSRATGDMLMKIYKDQYDLPIVFTRSANVYGPGQQIYRIIPKTILSVISEKKLILDGGGKSKRVFIHIDEVCDATYKLCLAGRVGEIYHISNYEVVKIIDCVKMILGKLHKKFNKYVEIGPERPGKDLGYFLDSKKIQNHIGWKSSILLKDGLDGVIKWMYANEKIIKKLNPVYKHKK